MKLIKSLKFLVLGRSWLLVGEPGGPDAPRPPGAFDRGRL